MIFMTTVRLSQWGNSSGIRIPNPFLKRMNLVEGMELEARRSDRVGFGSVLVFRTPIGSPRVMAGPVRSIIKL